MNGLLIHQSFVHTVTKLPCQNIRCFFLLPALKVKLHSIFKDLMQLLSASLALYHLFFSYSVSITLEPRGKIPTLVRATLKLEAAQLLSRGITSGFPVLLLSSAAGVYRAFVS